MTLADCMQIVSILVNLLRDSVLCMLCYVFILVLFQSTYRKLMTNSSFIHSYYHSVLKRLNQDYAR